MSPRLLALPALLHQSIVGSTSLTTQLVALPQQLLQQSRNAHILSSLSDNPSAYNKRIRRGRGPASGKGKTSGRGHGGQKQHSKTPAGFNGGQTPDHIVHGERGFKNVLSLDLAPINLSRIQSWIDQRRIDPTRPITVRELADSRCIHQVREGVKLLTYGRDVAPLARTPSPLKQPIHIVVSRASASAIAAVEAAGGSVTTRYYTPASIARIIRRETHPFISMAWERTAGNEALLNAAGLIGAATSADGEEHGRGINEMRIMQNMGYKYRLPDPTARRDIEYYRDPAKRGYLSHLLRPNEGPSLFFRSPVERKSSTGVKEEKKLPENRLW